MPLKFSTFGGVDKITGTGAVVDISSKGLSFRGQTVLPAGVCILASLAWPARLNDQCPLQLVVEGRVIRTDGTVAIMSILRYEFRTAGGSSTASPDDLAETTRHFEAMIAN